MHHVVKEHHRDDGEERTEGGDFDSKVVVRPVHEAFEAHREGEAERDERHPVEERRERSRVHGGERARDRGEKLECHKQDLDHSCVMRVEGGMSRVGRRGYGLVNLQFDSFEFDFTIQMAK